ncbi:MAG: tetratricopeptide repeat protein [Ktedonobacteraceae bacterium]
MGRRLGLIIGVNTYQDTTLQPLQYAETDARALAQWLVHTRGGQWNPADVQVVLGREATRELTETLITQLCLHMATSEDLILIYFAGHAFVDQASGDGYLACSNTRSQQASSGLHLLSLVSQVMARSPAAQILCILDCFQNGPAWSMRRASAFDCKPLLGLVLQNGLQQMQGRLLYCTCRGNEMAPEVSEKNLGSFMYRFVMGVGGPALDPANGQLVLQRLHAFLSERLDEQHKPQIFGQESRPIVLVGEMPTFRTGALPDARSGGLPPLPLGGSLAGQGMSMAASALAQLSPSASGIRSSQLGQMSPSTSALGRATPSTVEQNRRNQCQQMLNQAQQLVQMQMLQQAYQQVEMILQMDAQFVDALILKGQILGAIGQFQEALATAQQVLELDPQNALGWSMAAALLANTGQFPEAMSATNRSLSIDPSNTETLSMKEMIREKLAESQFDTGKRSRLKPPKDRPHDTALAYWLGMGIQVGALILGLAGVFLNLLKPSTPKYVAFLLESIALAVLIVNAWRGAYLYGFKRFLSTLLLSVITLGILAAFTSGLVNTRIVVKPAYTFLVEHASSSATMLTPLIFLILWLAGATVLPFLTGLIGWIVGAVVRGQGKRK